VRIALVSTPFVPVPPPSYGGTELIVGELAEGLVRRGHHVTLFTCGGSRARCEVRALYRHHRWPPDPSTELDHAAWSVEQIRQGSFDLVHAHVPSVLAFSRLVGVPLVCTVHHDRAAPYASLYHTLYARAGAQLVCISERQRALSPELDDARVIHHGLDPSRYAFGDGAGGYVAFLGRFARCKGVHSALDAAHLAGMPIQLGGTPHWEDADYHRREVRPRLERPGACQLGEVGGARKTDFLRRARALLFPIAWEEPFGLVMIEAMLSGTPVIAFAGGAVEEVVEEGVTGYVVRSIGEMAARIRELDGFDRARCWRRACERWSAARMVDDHLRLYQELMYLDERRRIAAPGA
jgi:glycosyltransferase involved in cell wall biosynthesis